jgi:hypothetical protein
MPGLYRRISAVTAGVAAAALLSLAAHAQTNGTGERFIANAVNMNAGAAGSIEIVVERWSTDANRDKLMAVMMDKGPDKLLDALQDMPRMGYFRAPGQVGIDIHFARRISQPEGGERVVLVTDRRIGFAEAANQPRSIDYPFTVIEMRLNRDGEGEGKMSVATKIIADKENNIVTLENYDTQPVMLNNVRREKTSQ